MVVCKGAPEAVLAADAITLRIAAAALAADGLRVLAVAATRVTAPPDLTTPLDLHPLSGSSASATRCATVHPRSLPRSPTPGCG